MTRRTVFGVFLVLQLIVLLVSSFNLRTAVAAKTWYVNDDGGADFTKIQDAINAASPGDTIFVYNGTYHEHVLIDKSLTLTGENENATIIDGTLNGAVVRIVADSVRISLFTLRNGTDGLRATNSSNHIITNNAISFNAWSGVYMENASNTLLSNNNVTSNKNHGMYMTDSLNNTISYSTLHNNTYYGIRLENASLFSVIGNTISQNQLGGINIYNASSNVFHHNNFVNNAQQVRIDDGSTDTWDNGVEGNYWNDYTGTDFQSGSSQTLAGSDGIGDTPYIINASNQDRYPLMGQVSFFDAGIWNSQAYSLSIASNSTLSNYMLNKTGRTISFNVTGTAGSGFCRVTIPNAVVQGLFRNKYKVLVDGIEIGWTKWVDTTYNYVYFTYAPSEHKIEIQALEIESPFITILSPENKTYASKDVPLTFALSEPTSWKGYSLDGNANVTIGDNVTLTDLSDGMHWVIVYANDTAGNMGYSDPMYFTVDTVAPVIEVLSPGNITYTTSSVSLSISVSEPTSWRGYSLDGQANQTISATILTVSDLSNGSHNIRVFANDTVGNTGASATVYFTINAPSPQPPQQSEPFPTWAAVAVAIVAVAIIAVLIYFTKFRKKPKT